MDSSTMTSEILSKITEAEKNITKSNGDVVTGGPTAMAQKHLGDSINSKVLHDITEGEKNVTHQARPVAGGPTAILQSTLSKSSGIFKQVEEHHSGVVDGALISKISEAEKKITDAKVDMTAGGPTAMAQKHTGEGISTALHDITEGEKKVTHFDRPMAGGPTAIAMSELAKARQEKAEKQTAV